MATYVFIDMDDTLYLGENEVNDRVAQFMAQEHEAGKTIAIVSGRQISRMQETRDWLQKHGLFEYVDEIHLSDFPVGPNASREFKMYKLKLIESRGNRVAIAVENDAETRAAYRALGVESVAPSRVPLVDGGYVDPENEQDAEEGENGDDNGNR